MPPLISICIPVYNTESTLQRCLNSVAGQTFCDFEVVILNDCSTGTDKDGRTCKKIIHQFKKHIKNHVEYIVHKKNEGIVKTRLDMVYAARGKYIFMLDSDDFLDKDALLELSKPILNCSSEELPDIVQGKSEQFELKNGEVLFLNKPRDSQVLGIVTWRDIFHYTRVNPPKISSFLWNKLIDREVVLNALENVPSVYCTVAEDLLFFFFISLCSKLYIGIDFTSYYYCVNTGITSNVKVETLDQWESICSVSSVFTVLFDWCQTQENLTGKPPLEADELNNLRNVAVGYLQKNLIQFNKEVLPELKEDAHKILEDFWGESLVRRVEAEMKKKYDKNEKTSDGDVCCEERTKSDKKNET